MTDQDVPDFAAPAMRRLNEQLSELRTRRIRLHQAAEEAAREAADPDDQPDPVDRLRTAALARDAPIELVHVARAVREGRTSWEGIVAGEANAVPEVDAARARAQEHLQELIDSGALRDMVARVRAGSKDHDQPEPVTDDDWPPLDDDEFGYHPVVQVRL